MVDQEEAVTFGVEFDDDALFPLIIRVTRLKLRLCLVSQVLRAYNQCNGTQRLGFLTHDCSSGDGQQFR